MPYTCTNVSSAGYTLRNFSTYARVYYVTLAETSSLCVFVWSSLMKPADSGDIYKVWTTWQPIATSAAGGNCHAHISCRTEQGWCSEQPSGGDSKLKRSEPRRQGLKPSAFSPRLTSKRGISPAGNFCCVNTQPQSTRQDRGDFVCRWCFWVILVIVEVPLIIIWSVRVEKCGVKCFLFIGDWSRKRLSLAAAPLSVSCAVYTSAVCPLKPVSSVFLHFLPCLPCERGTTPLHSRSVCTVDGRVWPWLSCTSSTGCSQVSPQEVICKSDRDLSGVTAHIAIIFVLGIPNFFIMWVKLRTGVSQEISVIGIWCKACCCLLDV